MHGGGIGTPDREAENWDKPPARKILVVDDDVAVTGSIQGYLEMEGYRPHCVSLVRDLHRAFEQDEPDAVILDLLLPDDTGWNALRWLRARSAVPIIILTSKSQWVDKVVGLELGADDYLAKPFELRELLARLHSVFRRIERPRPTGESAADDIIKFAGWMLDLVSQQLKLESGERVHLTQAEYGMLSLLVRNANEVVTRDQLMSCLGNRQWEPLDRSIDIQISRLRSKIDLEPTLPSLIRTMRGRGYMFVPNRG